jgi:adenine-specific DNA methylase
MTEKKKLIEVALPLKAINAASAREKSIRHGHPSTLHLWWARRPLAAARAVIFAQMVDDPSAHPDLSVAGTASLASTPPVGPVISAVWITENLPLGVTGLEYTHHAFRATVTGEAPRLPTGLSTVAGRIPPSPDRLS